MKKCKLPKLDLATTTDELRLAMQHIMFDGVSAWATDAHCMCRWIIDGIANPEQSQGKFMHWQQWKTLRGLPGPYEICETGIWCFEKQVLVAWSNFDGKFPDIKAAVNQNSIAMDYACVIPRYFSKCAQIFGSSDWGWQIGYTGKLITIVSGFPDPQPKWVFACMKTAPASHWEFPWWDGNYTVTNFKP